jgi:hypothetical protein
MREALGERHPDALVSLANLASCLDRLGRSAEAEPLHRQALALRREALGERHPSTLGSLNNLAYCLDCLGRAAEAKPLCRRAWALRREALGERHPDTLGSLNNLACCLDDLGQAEAALEHVKDLARLLAQQPSFERTWMHSADQATIHLSQAALANRLPDWPDHFQALDQAFRPLLDLAEPAQLAACRGTVTQFYLTYLGLCLDLRQDLALEAFAGLQGRKLAALALEDLEQASAPPESLRGRFQSLRLKLRQLALGLSVTDGGRLLGPDPGDRQPDADALNAEQRRRGQAYQEAFAEFSQARAELQRSDPDFALSAKALKPELREIQAKLAEDEAFVALMQLDGRAAAFIVRRDQTAVRPLPPGLAQACDRLREQAGHRYAADLETPAEAPGQRLMGGSLQGLSADEERLDDIALAMQEALWRPLREALPGLRRLHLASHGDFHRLPYGLSCPADWQLSTYPGLVYYYLLRHLLPPAPFDPAQATLGLRVHDAAEGSRPIPWVNAEADLVARLWPGAVRAPYQFAPDAPPAQWLHLAAHGGTPDQDASRDALHFGPGLTVGFHELFNSLREPRQPWGVFLAACRLGRVHEDPDGDPLGFMGALFLRGARYVIAALQPVPDLYMPLLACLFYQSWQRDGGHPAQALAEAKRRILAGDWYADTEGLIREACRAVGERGGGGPGEAEIDRLCAERDRLPVAAMCHWVRGFGPGF